MPSSKPQPILVSACLLGLACRYDGRAQARDLPWREDLVYIPCCPEQMGGLPTPRPPAEIRGQGVYTAQGQDLTPAFEAGAQACLALVDLYQIRRALLKSKSPSCGRDQVYDGSFSGRLVAGSGITAQRLVQAGVQVYQEDEVQELLDQLDQDKLA